MEKIELIGNIGRDAEVKSHNGEQFVTLSVACSKKVNGEDKTNWYDVVTPNVKLAEYLKKGTKIYLRGNFKLDSYYSEKLGKTLPKIAITAKEIELLSSKKEDEETEE